jgi:hypothetical protein
VFVVNTSIEPIFVRQRFKNKEIDALGAYQKQKVQQSMITWFGCSEAFIRAAIPSLLINEETY